jgi:hypothetical protein
MSLPDGDYRALEQQAVAVILADSDSGGLCEPGQPAVATAMAGAPALAEAFGQDRFPAILIRAEAKTETPAAPAYAVVKSFTLVAWIIDRGLDREAVEVHVRRIVARLETLFRLQSATDRQFLGLPDLIAGSEGVLVSVPESTEFPPPELSDDHIQARARLRTTIQVPCAFRYE